MERAITDAHDALTALVGTRLDALGIGPTAADRFSGVPLPKFGDAVRTAKSDRQLLALGAVWALRLAEAARTPRDLDSALFRLAQHLRASSTNAETPPIQRSVLDAAAREAFGRLRSTPSLYRGRVDASELEAAAVQWSSALGEGQRAWLNKLELVRTGIHRPTTKPVRRARPEVRYPGWLVPPPASNASSRLSELATWRPSTAPDDSDVVAAARAAYVAFVDLDFAAAREEARAVEDGLGTSWAPAEAAAARSFFAWVRAIPLVNLAHREANVATAHHLLSGLELLRRVNEPNFEHIETALLDLFLVMPTGDHVADLDWASLRYRLARLLGHEAALADLDNTTKAALRSFWKQIHRDISFDDDSTVGMIRALDSELAEALTHLQTSTVGSSAELDRHLAKLRPFCDADERATVDRVRGALEQRVTETEFIASMQVLRELANVAEDAADDVRESGSLLLQETLLPQLARLSKTVAESMESLSSAGGPELVVELLTDRLPLLHVAGTALQVKIVVQNQGTMAARNVHVLPVSGATVEFDPVPVLAGDVPAGARRTITLDARLIALAGSASFDATVSWDDEYDRDDQRVVTFFAEAERQSSWSDTDRNPFQLSSIEDPDRLIGRDEYVQRFRDIARSGGSMYVTGLKRVGKTSLVRVALTLLERENALVVYLPLGRALGSEQAAGDLVMHMLTKLEGAAVDALGRDAVPELDTTDHPNFSRLADRWLTRLRRSLPAGTTAAIAFDDFDELPANLRSGAEGDALFLFLRTIVDESWISVTFIGSEVLPTLLSQQSQRLNQVDPIQVHNFGSRESTGELLRLPSASRFDWTDEAIDLVHTLTEGNPCYATILGGRVWSTLRERGRTLAQESDVNTALEGLAASETQSHFMHLWSDDPDGLDAASPRAIRSSAVLRAVARCSTTPGALVDRDEIVAVSQQWIPGSTSDLLQEACSSLVRRGVLHEADSGQLRLRIPLVGAWLQGAGGRHLDETYRESPLARPAAKVVTASDYRQLARNLTYQSKSLSALDLQGWVEQLPDQPHQYLAFQMLKRACTTGFFSQQRVLTEVIPRLTETLREGPLRGGEQRGANNYLTGVVVLDHGESGSSAPALLRRMLSSLRITKAAVASEADVADRVANERPSIVLVFDEFAGSGNQLSGVLRDLVERLDARVPDWRDETTIAVGIGVAPGRETVDAFLDLPCEVAIGLTLGPEVRAFDEEAKIFDSEADRVAAKDLMEAVGRVLSIRAPLGFQGQGLLVVFESNCPNNALPALWKNGTYSGRPWLPLFERMEKHDRATRAG